MSEEMYIDGILAQDYGTPYSISFYSKNYNLKFGETINMSEEEIIKLVERVINNAKYRITFEIDKKDVKAIQGLLDLYKKEKERADKLQEENEELKGETYQTYVKEKCKLETLFYNYISKDKIRNKIKELEEELEKEMKEVKDFTDFNPMIPVLMAEIDTLKELLKEN